MRREIDHIVSADFAGSTHRSYEDDDHVTFPSCLCDVSSIHAVSSADACNFGFFCAREDAIDLAKEADIRRAIEDV